MEGSGREAREIVSRIRYALKALEERRIKECRFHLLTILREIDGAVLEIRN